MIKNIGFLFNHDAVHQVAHIAPIIIFLRKLFPRINVVAMLSSDAQIEQLGEILGTVVVPGLEIRKLETPAYLQGIFNIANTFAPVQRLYILKQYKSMFEELDCLIVPEMTSTRLKTHLGMKSTPLILLPHGAGDRAIGFAKEIKHFDYVLLSGSKVRDRMLDLGLIRKDNHSLIGYPKFDTIKPGTDKRIDFFNNQKPVVLYNPHFDAGLSSWYALGIDVLEFFSRRPDFNLIVAPHVMLYKKRLHISLQSGAMKLVRSIPQKYFQCPNIRIDLGSNKCVNMEYTINSDIYLGDVSSQIYEFLHKPRPCIFLNAHQARWHDNPDYKHWHCGPVLENIAGLTEIFEDLEAIDRQYRNIQIRSFAETFDLKIASSSLRAAQSIVSFLDSRTALAA